MGSGGRAAPARRGRVPGPPRCLHIWIPDLPRVAAELLGEGLDPDAIYAAAISGAYGGVERMGDYLSRLGVGVGATAASSDVTNFQFVQEGLRYRDPRLRLNATASIFGISMSQARALDELRSEELTGIGRLLSADQIRFMSATGIQSTARIATGDRETLENIADELQSRRGAGELTNDERRRLASARDGDNEEEFRKVLAELSAGRQQEETEGSRTGGCERASGGSPTGRADLRERQARSRTDRARDSRRGAACACREARRGADADHRIAQRANSRAWWHPAGLVAEHRSDGAPAPARAAHPRMSATRKIGGAAGVQPLSAASRKRALDVLRRKAEVGDVAACEALVRPSLERQLAKAHRCPC